MNECRNNYLTSGKQDRYIVVRHNGDLIDGYIMFLILKELNIDEVEIKISEKRKKRWCRKDNNRLKRTTYIYGVHPSVKYTSGHSKEYVWRVPNSWIGWADDLLPGDVIYADTKNGVVPVVVSRIECLDRCPVDFRIKKVIGKIKIEEG